MSIIINIKSELGIPEDASAQGENYAFAFDGLGGRGGKRRTRGDQTSPEAKIASEACAAAVHKLIARRYPVWQQKLDFSSKKALERLADDIAEEVKQNMQDTLHVAAIQWNAADGLLPTTIAGWITFPAPEGRTFAICMWAGDSRCYTIDAKQMKMYSEDDTPDAYRQDAMMDCLIKDSLPMNNRLGLDMEDLPLNRSCHMFEAPVLLFACTDGFYNCSCESPMHLEYYFRQMEGESSFEGMEQAWTAFIRNEGRLDDDSATLASIFVNPDPTDVECLRQMLRAGIEDIEHRYIEPFPSEEPQGEMIDIDSRIKTLANNLCRDDDKYGIYEALRSNVRRYVSENAPFPADLPCASAVRQMSSDYQWKMQQREKERESYSGQVSDAKAALAARVAGIRRIEPYIHNEETISDREDGNRGRFRDPRQAEAAVNTILNNIFCYMYYQWRANRMSRKWSDLGLFECREPFPYTKREAMERVEEYLLELYSYVNQQAEREGIEHLSRIRTSVPKLKIRKEPLTKEEQQQLMEILLETDGPAEPKLHDFLLYVSEITDLISLTDSYHRAQKDLEEYDRDHTELPEISMDALEEHLAKLSKADVRYLIEAWLAEGRKPSWFVLPETLENLLRKNIQKLQEMEASNETFRQQKEALKQQKIELWQQYRTVFEASKEPFDYQPPVPDSSASPEPPCKTEDFSESAPAGSPAVNDPARVSRTGFLPVLNDPEADSSADSLPETPGLSGTETFGGTFGQGSSDEE